MKHTPKKQKNTKNYNEALNQYETKNLHPLNLYLNSKNIFKKYKNPKNLPVPNYYYTIHNTQYNYYGVI